MNILQFIITRKTLVSMVFIGLCMLGVISYRQLPMELVPNVEYPYLIVNVSGQREVNPEYMEQQAIIPLEGVVASLEGVSNIESTVDSRRGTIYIYFNQGVNIKYANLKLQEKVTEISASLPEEFRVSVVTVDTERLSNTFMQLQVRGSGGTERLRAVIEKSILNELQTLDGIANVAVAGGSTKSLDIVLNNDAVQAYNITAGRIRSLIAQNNSQKVFAGYAYEKEKQYFVNVAADYTDVKNIENIVVDTRGPVLLKDVATVTFGLLEPTSISRVNGKDAVTIQLVRDANVNLINLSHTTRKVIDRLNKELAYQDIQIVIQNDTAEDMEKNINLIIQLAIAGGMFAVVILWFFMKNVRLVTTVMLAIPISILTAFNFFYLFGITINSLTLVGIALAVGMLLDNSVVVLENIYRHLALHQDRTTAVLEGTKEVWRAIVASTLTTITVFVPFIFSTDYLVQTIGRHVGISIISTLLVSLLVALTLIPVLAHWMLRSSDSTQSFNKVSQRNRLMQIYTLLLKSAIRYPARTVFGATVLFFASIIIGMGLNLDVAREVELSQFNLYVTMPRGSTLEFTDTVVSDLESKLTDIEEIQDVITTVYEEEANVTIVLKKDFEKIKKRSVEQIKNVIDQRMRNFTSADVSLTEPQASTRYGSGMGRDPVASLQRMFGIGSQTEKIVIKGSDYETLQKVADDVQYFLEEDDTITRVSTNVTRNRPEIHVLFDTQLLSRNSISQASISGELSSFQSEVSSGLKFKQGTDEYNIVIRNESLEADKTIDDLRKIRVTNNASASFELDQISQIVYAGGMSTINRVNQEKQVEVTYAFDPEINQSKELLTSAREDVDAMVASMTLPPGVAVEAVHDETDLSEFYFLIGAAFILIFMILASVFESVLTPVVMMFTIPLATIGSLWALILTGNSLLNANSLIGFLILIGVVVNNGILLIDYTNILRHRGHRRSRALMAAGQVRVRPILITAITTIVAMIPLAMGKAEYVTRIGAPFAITVIGGLSLSTLFTLVFIPTVYSGMETALEWIRSLSMELKLAQAVMFAGSVALILHTVDSLFWQYTWVFFSVVAIPGLTWFVLTSLRQARADFFGGSEPITISVRRVVKIYDNYSRFVREWKKEERMRALEGRTERYTSWRDFGQLPWQVCILGFLVYFVYLYIDSSIWHCILIHAVYFFTLFLLIPVGEFLGYRAGQSQKKTLKRIFGFMASNLVSGFMWLFPLFSLAVMYRRQFRWELMLLFAFFWYAALVVYATSNRLYRRKINIMRLTGRFAGIRRYFYRFVGIIPVIGKKKKPFNALDGVSLTIKSGMFGLLGPNGAGKTTLMRIICGILDMNMGTIRFNAVDFEKNREELQGLIGYLPQEFGMYENMTAYEFLDYIAILKNILDAKKRKQIVDNAIASVHLSENSNQKIGSFSGGMKQRMGIAMTLLHLPRILVVDEPTAGLDPRERIRFRNLLVELSRDRIVIFSTHIIEDISSSCNTVAVLEKGRLYYLGEPQEMTKTAYGNVWQFIVTPETFEKIRKMIRIVHHIRVGEHIRIRCLADSEPYPGAVIVQPTLEDAYLWLIGRKEKVEVL